VLERIVPRLFMYMRVVGSFSPAAARWAARTSRATGKASANRLF
jgi:hypothetical protein